MPARITSQQHMKARLLMARNIHAILTARHQSQASLALWCRKSPNWINKILAGRRGMHIDDFDRVADFLGIAVYQLFQPGIGHLTERRKPGDRRTARDRRIGHTERIIALDDGFGTRDGHAHTDGGDTTSAAAAQAELDALISDFTLRANSLLARADTGRQAPRTRRKVSSARASRGHLGGPDAVKPEP